MIFDILLVFIGEGGRPDREDGLVDFSNQIAYFGERINLEFKIFNWEMIE